MTALDFFASRSSCSISIRFRSRRSRSSGVKIVIFAAEFLFLSDDFLLLSRLLAALSRAAASDAFCFSELVLARFLRSSGASVSSGAETFFGAAAPRRRGSRRRGCASYPRRATRSGKGGGDASMSARAST